MVVVVIVVVLFLPLENHSVMRGRGVVSNDIHFTLLSCDSHETQQLFYDEDSVRLL